MYIYFVTERVGEYTDSTPSSLVLPLFFSKIHHLGTHRSNVCVRNLVMNYNVYVG